MKKQTQADKIRAYATAHPAASIAEIAKKLNIRYQAVYAVLKTKPSVKKPKKLGRPHKIAVSQMQVEAIKKTMEVLQGERRHPVTGKILMQAQPEQPQITMVEPKADNVNHPAHYTKGGMETIDFIESKSLNYLLGNVVKYVTRADHKGNREEDLLKARWYLNREIAKFQKI